MVVVNIDGQLRAEHEAVVSVFDHGFLYGDGVYEVMRTYHRVPFRFDDHMQRLRESARMVALPVPFSDADVFDRVRTTIAALPEAPECYVRVLLTRGVGGFTYDPRACPIPGLVIIVKDHTPPPEAVYEHGVGIALVTVVRNHPRSVDPRIKSNNLLNNALAMQEAIARGAFEALMKNYKGELTECSQSNFFLVKAGVVTTPPVDAGLLEGITRRCVLELARDLGLPTAERPLFEGDLDTCDEAFLTSTTREIVPVVRIDDRVIGGGTPGPVARRLLAAYRAAALAASRQPTQPAST